jgi:cold-inducible RNA-binding protein
MNKKLYVGGIPYSFENNDLERLFSESGTVVSAKVIIDRDTGRSKGFGFVEMSSAEEAQQAIKRLNGSTQDGKSITVNEAKPESERRGGGGGGHKGNFGGGGNRNRDRY